MAIEDLREIGNVLYERRADGMLYPVRRVRPDTEARGVAPRKPSPLDMPGGIAERLAFLNQTFNPVEGIGQSMRAGERLFSQDADYLQRIEALGSMLSGVAGIAAPIAAARAIGVPAASAMMEGLLGFSPTTQAAGDTMRAAGRDIVDRLNQPGPVPVMYSNPIPGVGRGGGLDVSRRDASNIFGAGSERVRYTDPRSGGTIEVVVRPDGSASVLELEVPEASRGQGIGQTLQERVMQDFPVMGGQVSSKAAATTAYRLGRRPPGKPDATLEEVFADIDEMSSVNMVSPRMQERIAPNLTFEDVERAMQRADESGGFRLYQGSPYNFNAERLVRYPDGRTEYIVGRPDVLPDVPAGAEVLRDFPLGRQRMDKIGTGEGAQAYGYGLYGAEAEGIARSYRDALSRPYLATADGQNIAEKYGSDVADIFEMAGGEPDDMRATVTRLRQIVKENLDDIGVSDVSQLKSEFYGDLPSTIIDFSNRADRLENLLNSGDVKLVNEGKLYELNVNANPEDFLDWDLPLSQQPKTVQDAFKPRIEALRKLGASIGNDPDGATLEQIAHPTVQLDDVDWNRGLRQQASDFMREAGVPGIRYLDAGSRSFTPTTIKDTPRGSELYWGNDPNPVDVFPTRQAAEEAAKQFDTRSRNYVVFDENLINIVRKYGIAGAAAMLGVSAVDVEEALAQGMPPSQWDQLVVGPQ